MSTKTNTNTYSLKSYKSFAQMSEETVCFHANLYRNGKKVGTVKNQGFGGPNDFDGTREEEAILIAHCATLPEWESSYGDETRSFKVDMDYFISTMVEEMEEKKWRKSQCARKTLFRLVGDDDTQWRVISHKFDQRVHDYLIKTHGDQLGEIMNITNKAKG